jgi:hypothetical protein
LLGWALPLSGDNYQKEHAVNENLEKNRMDAARNGANLVKIPFSTFSNFQG